MSTNIELDAVWAAIPQREALQKRLADVKEKRAAMAPAPDPEEARQAVIAEAAQTVADGKTLPRGVGKKAATAYLDALALSAERQVLADAERTLTGLLADIKETHREDALAALGTRLEDVLSTAREIVARSGRLITADIAVDAGGTAVEDFRELRRLVRRLDDVRDAQRSILMPTDKSSYDPAMSEAIGRGHDEVRNLVADPAPEHLEKVLSHTVPRTVEFLIWLAESGRAWVPESEAALLAERMPADVGAEDRPVTYTTHTEPEQPRGPIHRGGQGIPSLPGTAPNLSFRQN